MSYENSTQCVLLATHCCVCGKALVDATSVQLGIGPDCRRHIDGGISEETRKTCNILTHEAALAAQEGNIAKVRKSAEMIRTLGLDVLAEKILKRFQNAERLSRIRITETEGGLIVKTPWKHSRDFAEAWRAIPGRTYRGAGKTFVPLASKREVWEILKRFFPGMYGVGPQGPFKIPKKEAA